MNILVTGGAGFIGSNFIIYWLKKYPNDVVVNLDKLTYAGNLDNLSSIWDNPNYRFIKGDICDAKLTDTVMEGIDWVVNFAAESHVDRSIMEPAAFIQTNVLGTQVLLEAARDRKVKRFHHISTDEVYGSLSLKSQKKFSEESKVQPRSPYAASKAASDHLVNAFYHTYGLPVSISNCSNNYGPYQHPEKLIPLVITNLLEEKEIPIYGDGLHVRDWLYVEDHCRAVDLVIREGKVGQTYCVGATDKEISNLQVVKKIIHILGKRDDSIRFVKDRKGHDRRYAIDWSKINKELHWSPNHDFDTWLEKTVAWYKKNKNWWKKIRTKKFDRYYQKQYITR